MEIIPYITINLLLFPSWYILLFRAKNSLSFVDRILGTFILGLSQIVLTEVVLGVLFKRLFAMPLFILNISISLGVLIFAVVKREQTLMPQSDINKDEGVIARAKPMAISKRFFAYARNDILGANCADIFKELKDKINQFINIIKIDWILMTIFILFFISFCYLIFIGYLFPSYSWDALLTHLPTIGFILQSGAIENIPYNSLIYIYINAFPKNINLFLLWNVIFLKSGSIVDLSQLPFTIAGMLAIYSIAIKLKIKQRYAVYSSLLFFFAPIIILQSTTNYVDIAVSVLFLIAINFLTPHMSLRGSQSEPKQSLEILRYAQNDKRRARNDKEQRCPNNNLPILLSGLSAGLLLGSKGPGPLYILALSALFFINELRMRFSIIPLNPPSPPFSKGGQGGIKKEGILKEGREDFRSKNQFTFKRIIERYAVYFLMPVILLGSYWYINNWIHYGNPFYPFTISLFGRILFRGILSEMLNPIPDAIGNLHPIIKPLYVWLERTGHYYYALELGGFGPLWFILFLPAIGFSVFFTIRKKKYDFLFIAMAIIFAFIFYPMGWTTRYIIFLFGLGCLSFGIALDYFGKREKILKSLTLLLVIYVFLVSNSPSVTPQKIKDFIHLPAEERTLPKMEEFILNQSQRGEYGMWAWVAENVKEGDTLAYTYTPTLIGPLWNSSFSNKTVYIKSGSFENWLKALEANKANYIVIKLKPRSMESWWLTRLYELRNTPQWSAVYNRFRLLYSDSEYLVVRFK